jgi:AraC-like DNA-binding protein
MNAFNQVGGGDWISGATVAWILRSTGKLGVDLKPILNRTELRKFGNRRDIASQLISRTHFAPVYLECMQVFRSYFAAAKGCVPPTPDEVDLLCSCLINCENLAEGVQIAIRFSRALHGRVGTPSLDSGAPNAVFALDTARARNTEPALLCDLFGLFFYYKLFSWLIDEPLPVIRLTTVHRKIVDDKVFSDMIDCPLQFEAPCNSLWFHRDILARPVVRNNQELLGMLASVPFELAALPRATRLSARIENIVRRTLAEQGRLPSVEDVASLLGKSSPTLRRHLAQEQVSYNRLREKCRMEKAVELLGETAATIDEIAERLGFSAASGFSRAFKDWIGCSPSAYRRRLAAQRA